MQLSSNRGERGSHHGGPQLQKQQQTAGPDEGKDEEQLSRIHHRASLSKTTFTSTA